MTQTASMNWKTISLAVLVTAVAAATLFVLSEPSKPVKAKPVKTSSSTSSKQAKTSKKKHKTNKDRSVKPKDAPETTTETSAPVMEASVKAPVSIEALDHSVEALDHTAKASVDASVDESIIDSSINHSSVIDSSIIDASVIDSVDAPIKDQLLMPKDQHAPDVSQDTLVDASVSIPVDASVESITKTETIDAQKDNQHPIAQANAQENVQVIAESEPVDASVPSVAAEYPQIYNLDLANLTLEDRAKIASEAKTIGNKLYSEKQFEKSIQVYTQAILLAPTSVYYSNRAAAYANLGQYENVVSDCTNALKLDAKYLKALNRRAIGYEKLGKFNDSLNDYTAICVLEGFRNESSMAAPDRVLKIIAANETEKVMKNKVPQMPSPTFIRAYMDSFRAEPSQATIIYNIESDAASIAALKKALQHLTDREWKQAFEACIEAINLADFGGNAEAESIAYNLRGTFHFLMGRIEESISDIDRSLELDGTNINSMIKRGTLCMERGDVAMATSYFDKAEAISPKHIDLFYHRGQVRFLTNDFQGAIQDYIASLKHETPKESSVYVHIQIGVAKYKLGDEVGAEKKFKEAKRLFPDSAEIFNYHGEIMMDKKQYAEALKCFDKSISMDATSPLPYINKGLLYVQWKQELAKAEAECRKALECDPLCDIAYAQLAQLLCHQNRIKEALEVYNDAVKVTRTEAEVMNFLSCREAAAAQLYVVETYPDLINALAQA